MVQLTRLNHETFLINSDLIEQVDVTPDTVITLTNGHKFLVRESAEEVARRVLEFRRSGPRLSAFPGVEQAGVCTR
jgi:flagellar protein FlbD